MTVAPRLDHERLRRARAYRAFQISLGIASTLVGVAAMLALYALGLGIEASRWSQVFPAPASTYAVIVAFTVIGWLVQTPFSIASWARGRREGLVVQSLTGMHLDRLKGLLLTLVLVGIPLTAWYVILPRPEWWLLTIVGVTALSAVGTLLGPVLTSVFFKFEPLGDETVAGRVRAVAERAGVRVSGVHRILLGAKTTAANAMVVGIGPTKRIALGDTLLAHFPIDETEAVVAHEVGHDVSGDPPRYVAAFTVAGSVALILVRIAVDAITCGGAVLSPGGLPQPICGAGGYAPVNGAADPASYPLVAAALSVVGFVGRPLLMAFTRWRESAADAFGAKHTSPDAMARALVRLADQNLADPEPPRWEEVWFFSHPAIANRVRALGLRWEQFSG